MIAVKFQVGPSIMLQSGAWFDFSAPASSNFTIEDVAHGLANICRYAGQCRRFYSVAEHSILVSEVAEGYELEALLHDAAEAFMGDITRPLKQMIPKYKDIENSLEAAILNKFGLRFPLPPAVKEADFRVLAAEQSQIMPPGTDDWVRKENIVPAAIVVRHLRPEHAKRAFLDRYERLRHSRAIRQSQPGLNSSRSLDIGGKR
jgi:5'-nucleotidase